MTGHLRLIAAALLGILIPWMFGPDHRTYRWFAVSLGILSVLGGIIRSRTQEGGLRGDLATGALGLLMLAPAIGVRHGRVSEAIFTATYTAPHEVLYELPAITQTVPDAAGPLFVGAGLAMMAIAGRLGAVYVGIMLAAALASWVGHSLAVEAGEAMRSERFEDAVVYAQAMRFVGLIVGVGALAGLPFYRQGKVEWRAAMHNKIHSERMAMEHARRNEEVERVQAAHAELRSREAAAEAKRAREEAEAEQKQGVTIADLDSPGPDAEEAPVAAPDIDGAGGGFGEEDGEFEFESDPDGDDGDTLTSDTGAPSAELPDDPSDDHPRKKRESEPSVEMDPVVPELPELELEPRFDVESPIVVSVEPHESDPDSVLAADAIGRMRRIVGGVMLIAALAAGWASTPPWFEVLSALPDPGTNTAVPQSDPGISIARTPMDPFHKEFDKHLGQRGHGRLHGAPWACLQDTANFGNRYGTLDRGIEVLSVPADTPMIDLYDAVMAMRKRGVYRMGITGRAAPPYGPLGALFAWPAVQLLLDRPPRSAQWMHLKPRTLEELPLVPGQGSPQSCVLLLDESVKVNQVYNTARSLSSVYGDKRCQLGIAIVFPEDGTTTNPNPAWRGCP